MSAASWPDPADLADIVPLAERALSVDDAALVRLRSGQSGSAALLAAFARLPFEVLAGRTVSLAERTVGWPQPFDLTATAPDLLAWIDGSGPAPQPRDGHWLSPLPPRAGWERIEMIAESEIRALVRSGAVLGRSATRRTEQQSLLSSVVLRATSASGTTVEVPLGPITALTRMGFLPRGSSAAIDTAPGWLRVAAPFGSTFLATGAGPLGGLDILGGLGRRA